VLEIDGRRVLALSSSSIERARALCSEAWFVEEISCYRCGGHPIWNGGAELRVRLADAHEAMTLESARMRERARGDYAGYVFAFFVPLDPTSH
jgi:hypothetical protein